MFDNPKEAKAITEVITIVRKILSVVPNEPSKRVINTSKGDVPKTHNKQLTIIIVKKKGMIP